MPERHVIANRALGLVQENRISSFDQGTTESELVKENYESSVKTCLEDGAWNFAETAARLAKDASPARPDFDFSYAIPIDCIAPKWMLEPDGRISRIGYRISKSRLCTDLDNPWLVYTYRAPEYLFGSMFTDALVYLLASRISPALTETEAKTEQLYKLYIDAITRARSRNAQQDMAEQFDTTTFTSAHVG
jgi:hypothetical protein